MGNRANVVFQNKQNSFEGAVYLHWNGGLESVAAFMTEIIRRKYTREDALPLRFGQVVGEFFRSYGENVKTDSGCSVYMGETPKALVEEELNRIDPGDNGVFVIQLKDKGLGFTLRQFRDGKLSRTIETKEELMEELKKEGAGYIAGYENRPTEQYHGILESYLEIERRLIGEPEVKEGAA